MTSPHELLDRLTDLTPGQRRVALALIHGEGNTYQGAAEALGVSLETIYAQLKGIRTGIPRSTRRSWPYRQWAARAPCRSPEGSQGGRWQVAWEETDKGVLLPLWI